MNVDKDTADGSTGSASSRSHGASDHADRPVPTAPTKVQQWFPAGDWLPKYNVAKNGVADLIAALRVAALLIPESMG